MLNTTDKKLSLVSCLSYTAYRQCQLLDTDGAIQCPSLDIHECLQTVRAGKGSLALRLHNAVFSLSNSVNSL